MPEVLPPKPPPPKAANPPAPEPPAGRIDLLARFPWLHKAATMRSVLFPAVLINLAFFWLLMMAALLGHPVGSHNISIVFIWILWWFLLIVFLVPFSGRIWCAVCPFPAIGEWLQRGSIIEHAPLAKGIGLNKRWPWRFKNIWLQVFGFMGLALFSSLLVTRPIVTLMIVGGIWVLCTILMLVYEKRSFCVYLCPVSGFQGLYALLAPIEVRPRERVACYAHKGKHGCYFGAPIGDESSCGGYGCPWLQQPERLERNAYCGLCLECVKGCQRKNMTLKLRPMGSDLAIKGLDEAWKAFMMLVLAAVYSITLLGPYGTLKDWANATMTGQWRGFAIYAASAILSCLALFPAAYGVFAWASRKLAADPSVSFKDAFTKYSYVWVPMGLMAWIAFSVPLVMVNGAYILTVASDPFGWGWNLLGTAHVHWHPVAAETIPYIQSLLLMVGLVWSISLGYDVSGLLWKDERARWRSLVPIAAALLLVTAGFLRLFTA